ncbi:MAG TPA: hypothetical protein VLB46_05530 [Pyrinomonadaceae bacterium]|nr:hypothetical protein [Pyrinomonadaceae bacterium]
MTNQPAREMTANERLLLARLLETPFPGSDAVAQQLQNCLVRPVGSNGTLDFLIGAGPKAEVRTSVPVEAEAEDIDGITIHALLHVIEGTVVGLEVYKEDSSQVIKMPAPSELRIFIPQTSP